MGLFNRSPAKRNGDMIRIKRRTFNTVYVVGESNYQDAISDVSGRLGKEEIDWQTWAILKPEPENPHDKNAVRVEIAGRLVGYLQRRDAKAYGDAIQKAKAKGGYLEVRAKVVALPPDEADTPNAGVSLFIQEPSEVAKMINRLEG